MASIVAYIEVREGAVTPPSLFVISESRRIAQAVGATVYAFLPVGAISHVQIDQLAEQVSAVGADRILCCSDQTLVGPALDPTHGPVLAQLADHLRPLLVLFPAGGAGEQLGPPLAVRVGAAYVPSASIEIPALDRSPEPQSHRVLITRRRAAGDTVRRIDLGDLERPVIAVLHAGSPVGGLGESYAEVEMLPCPPGKHSELHLLQASSDPAAALEACSSLVCVSDGTPVSDLETLRTELPAGACLGTVGDFELSRATPESLFLTGVDEARLAIRAGAVWIVSGTPADLALALRRARERHGVLPA